MNRTPGFSLIELSIVLAVILIMAGISFPKLSLFYQRQTLALKFEQLQLMLNKARLEALINNSVITVCPTINRRECTNDWQQSIMVFHDKNKDNQRNNNEKLKTVFQATSELSVNRGRLLFAPLFFASNTTATLTLCSSSAADWQRALVVSNMGRIRVESNKDKIKC